MNIWTYRRPFVLDGTACEVRIRAGMDGLHSVLTVAGVEQAEDATPNSGPEAVRNHHLEGVLPSGARVAVEAGYRNWFDMGIAVRREGALVYESHPGAVLAYPKAAARMAAKMPAADPGQWERNRLPLAVDVGSGVLFFVVAKLTNLTTAALVGAALALVLVVLERVTRRDLTGGLVLFGVAMTLVAAGLALAFQTDEAVKWRSSVMGGLGAAVFLGDALLNRGRWIGKGLARYMPFATDPRRLATGMGLAGLAMALLNLAAMRLFSTDGWLLYHSFLDSFVAMGLAVGAMYWSRRREAEAEVVERA